MAIVESVYPDYAGLSEVRASREIEAAPLYQDWDQLIAEVLEHQSRLADFEGNNTPGAVPVATGVAGAEASGSGGFVHQTTITLTGVVLTTTDDATHGAFTSQELYDFPEGLIVIHGAVASLALVAGVGGLADTAAIVAGVGTSAAAQAGSDGNLAAAEANVIPSTPYTLSGGIKAATKALATAALYADGSASAKKAYLNFQCPTAGSSATDTLTVTGTVKITWSFLGDA